MNFWTDGRPPFREALRYGVQPSRMNPDMILQEGDTIFHAYLKQKGVLDGAELVHGYLNVVRKLVLPAGVEKGAPLMTA